jgi:hypothetical protein
MLESHPKCSSHPWGHNFLLQITHHHISLWASSSRHIQACSHNLQDVLILIKCQVL